MSFDGERKKNVGMISICDLWNTENQKKKN